MSYKKSWICILYLFVFLLEVSSFLFHGLNYSLVLTTVIFLSKVHIFGASLGGFLAQKFSEHTFKSPRVHSVILCNSFVDTTVFQQTVSSNL